MADLIVTGLYVATGLLVGFGFGVAWERHRWEDREHREAMQRIEQLGAADSGEEKNHG